eukprot:gene11962-8235_t
MQGLPEAREALEDRLKFLEDELLRSQPDYGPERTPHPPFKKIVPKTKEQVEEEMKVQRQKALFGTMLPQLPPRPEPVELPEVRDPRKKRKKRRSPQKEEKALYARAAAAAEAERPKEDPNALPLAPHFYSEAQERLFDKMIVEFDSEQSKEEYQSLVATYGEYLGGEEEDLWALWKRLGGVANWHKYLRPTQLTLLLSQEMNVKVRFRVEPDKLKYLEGLLVEEREAGAFFSNILPRLPKLEFVEIVDCPTKPFVMSILQKVRNPFPSLKGLYTIFVHWTADEVMLLLTKYCKHIEPGKMRIDPRTIQFTEQFTERNIIHLSNGLVSFVTPGNEIIEKALPLHKWSSSEHFQHTTEQNVPTCIQHATTLSPFRILCTHATFLCSNSSRSRRASSAKICHVLLVMKITCLAQPFFILLSPFFLNVLFFLIILFYFFFVVFVWCGLLLFLVSRLVISGVHCNVPRMKAALYRFRARSLSYLRERVPLHCNAFIETVVCYTKRQAEVAAESQISAHHRPISYSSIIKLLLDQHEIPEEVRILAFDPNVSNVETVVSVLRSNVDILVNQLQMCMETIQNLQMRIEILERDAVNNAANAAAVASANASPSGPGSPERFFWAGPQPNMQASPVLSSPASPGHPPVDERGNPIPMPFMGYVPPAVTNRQREEAILAMINGSSSPGATPTALGQVFPSGTPETMLFPKTMPQVTAVMPQGFQFNPSMTLFDPNLHMAGMGMMNPNQQNPNNNNNNNNNNNVQAIVLEPSRATNEMLEHVCMQPWIKELCLKGCKNISNFEALSRLRILWKLSLQGCSQFVDDSVLKLIAAHNKRLSRLNLCGCERVSDATPLAQLAYLFDLNLSGCQITNESLEAISNGCNQLSRLAINSCPLITSVSCIGKLKELKLLYCRYSDNIDPSGISDVLHAIGTNLLTLNVDGIKFRELDVHMPGPSAIKNLNFKDNTELTSLDWMLRDPALFPSLEMLDAEGCTNLHDLSNVSSLPALKTIRLSHTAVDNAVLADIASKTPSLTTLSLEGCDGVTDFSPLMMHSGLSKLCVDQQHLAARSTNGLANLQARRSLMSFQSICGRIDPCEVSRNNNDSNGEHRTQEPKTKKKNSSSTKCSLPWCSSSDEVNDCNSKVYHNTEMKLFIVMIMAIIYVEGQTRLLNSQFYNQTKKSIYQEAQPNEMRICFLLATALTNININPCTNRFGYASLEVRKAHLHPGTTTMGKVGSTEGAQPLSVENPAHGPLSYNIFI